MSIINNIYIFALEKILSRDKQDSRDVKNRVCMKQILLLLAAMLLACCSKDNEANAQTMTQKMFITIDGQTQSVTLVDNAATRALAEKLQQAPISVTLNSSGGFEIWGALGFSLPTSNQQMTAQPGDIVLYNGSNICLFYGSNSWSYTRLGKIDDLSESELRTFLKAGESNISVTLSLTGTTGIRSLTSSPKDEKGNYSPDGRKVNKTSKGIYIKGNKKIVL